MKIDPVKPRKILNKAFLKIKPHRSEIEKFKAQFHLMCSEINEKESEEFHKNLVIKFLNNTWYSPGHFINTKGKTDLVIYTGKDAKSKAGVLIEAKKPTNRYEMPTPKNLNCKALQELVLYFLRERITGGNLGITYLIVTNIYKWYIFEAKVFDRNFAQNEELIRLFKEFEEKRLSETNTDFFYKKIASPAIEKINSPIEFTYFDLREYEKVVHSKNKENDNRLIALYKILSPEHLLKLPFANDSNSLDKPFYSELLHLIGLTEVKIKNKKLIRRNEAGKRNRASLIENAIGQLESHDKISRLENPLNYGETYESQLFNVALELVISWINRILFLKLLEAQLKKYHKGDKNFSFLNTKTISDFDQLDELFFSVLACEPEKRKTSIQEKYARVPYLNSSLFEPTELEHNTIFISNLSDGLELPIKQSTVLKDASGKKKAGKLNAIQYLFEFLDAYDFTSEGKEEIQEENKRLINASVLGLIFEKINGYKDGSFFTPGFITMYMARETVHRAVIRKFNETKGTQCKTLTELYNSIDDQKEANQIINSLKVCDPAVGSGHFLVSVLNELIALKSYLKILTGRDGRILRDYHVEVENDELVVTDIDGNLFEYHPKNPESQRVQEALFHEKETLIENCLFGVDINPNSVKICQLRLWIELLKNAYYKTTPPRKYGPPLLQGGELETLPNIDINIKCGNSLVSRYPLDADLKKALSKSRFGIENYRAAVMTYRNAQNKEQKREMEKLIDKIKIDFKTEISLNDKRVKQLSKLRGELFELTNQNQLFAKTKTEISNWQKEVKKRTLKINALETELDEIKNNRIYKNAFEWRFEFPEVLNEDGDFTGFDIVIGNPPYIRQEEIKEQKKFLKEYYQNYTGASDLYIFFVEKGFDILRQDGNFNYIMPNKWMQAEYGITLRNYLHKIQIQQIIDFGDLKVFDEATTYPCILSGAKSPPKDSIKTVSVKTINFGNGFEEYINSNMQQIEMEGLNTETWIISSKAEQNLIFKLKTNYTNLFDYIGGKSYRGILTGLSEAFIIDEETKFKLIKEDKNSAQLICPFLLGRNIKPYTNPEVKKYLILIPKGFTIRKNLDPENPYFLNEPMHRYGDMHPDAAWEWFKTNYPAIANYLLPFKKKAELRTDKGDFWWELRACDYYNEFVKPKIMYQKFQVKPCFIYDKTGLFCNDSMWIIPTNDKILLSVLNSKLGWWLISKFCTAIQNGYQLIWKYFRQIPIAVADKKQSAKINELLGQILALKKQSPKADTSALEAEIDQLVYQLYGLTEEEIALVENSL